MNYLGLKEEKIVEGQIIKNIRNLLKLKRQNEAIKDRIIRDNRNLFEHEEEYYKSVTVGNFCSNN